MNFPRLCIIDFPAPPIIELSAVLPKMHMIFGETNFISVSRNCLHILRSSSLGILFAGGLHFTIFVMNTSDLRMPTLSRTSSNILPAVPTNGLPFSSSSLPGASPINIILACIPPSPGTAFFLDLQRSHNRHDIISFRTSSNASYFKFNFETSYSSS